MKLNPTIYPRGSAFNGDNPASELYDDLDGSAVSLGTSFGSGENNGAGRGYISYSHDSTIGGSGGHPYATGDGPKGFQSEGMCDSRGNCDARADQEDL